MYFGVYLVFIFAKNYKYYAKLQKDKIKKLSNCKGYKDYTNILKVPRTIRDAKAAGSNPVIPTIE